MITTTLMTQPTSVLVFRYTKHYCYVS